MNLNSALGKKWLFKEFDSLEVKKISEDYSLSEIVAKLICIRRKKIADIELFLNPKIKNLLPNPLHLIDMEKAIDRTYNSIIKNETIGIFGDYDVDGASSTALLARFFLSIKLKVETYIPDRHTEGYGPNIKSFSSLINKGSKIIFTVDCGTSSFDPIKFSQKKNIDVIVLDHHQSDIKLPEACAIVNPNRYDEKSDLNYLCAAGVCFVFLIALNKKLRDENWFKKKKIDEPNLLNYLDLVSLGTVCDVVPLIGLNRAIVTQGLKIFKKRSNLGLKTLYDLCKIDTQPTTYDLGYILGPRINAGGRVGKSSHGAELLISDDPKKTFTIASELEKSNKERQAIEALLSEQISLEVKKFHNHPVLVMAGNNWHEGIIGIVASRIKDKFNKPTILISLKNRIGKGSARSVVGFDIGTEIIKSVQSKILERGGGHKMAGGFTIKESNIPLFRDLLIKDYERTQRNVSTDLNLYLDSIIAPSAMNEDFYKEINNLAPFGSGNAEPKFMIENVRVISSRIIKEKHIKSILIGKDGSNFTTFAWNSIDTPLETLLIKENKKKINIAGKLKLNTWREQKKIELIVEDVCLN
ncbi:single-stranded-DNA-specific exonuclease RecJ [Pelagibacteraceae bacterium]|nr:single-stranded-DNA-specific exonuclease RecJ [Pelagibacteraceae bacterium]